MMADHQQEPNIPEPAARNQAICLLVVMLLLVGTFSELYVSQVRTWQHRLSIIFRGHNSNLSQSLMCPAAMEPEYSGELTTQTINRSCARRPLLCSSHQQMEPEYSTELTTQWSKAVATIYDHDSPSDNTTVRAPDLRDCDNMRTV